MNLAIGIWAALWTALAAVIAYRTRHRNRPAAAAWMITIAAFLAVLEDPVLLVWYASVGPRTDPDGVLGIIHQHVRGHLYGGGAMAAAGLILSVWVAHTALRRGERWAWPALLTYLLLTAAADICEVLFIYPHGFPLGITPPDGGRGFGWPELAAWILVWSSALCYCRPRPASRSRDSAHIGNAFPPDNDETR